MKELKEFSILIANIILLCLFPFMYLYIMHYLDFPYHVGITKKCIGNCEYQIESTSNDSFALVNSYSNEKILENIYKYKENKKLDKIYLIRKNNANDIKKIYTIFDYKNSEYENYQGLYILNNDDKKVFEYEDDFVNLYK